MKFQGSLGLIITFVGNSWHWNLGTLPPPTIQFVVLRNPVLKLIAMVKYIEDPDKYSGCV